MVISFDTLSACDGQTDGQTDMHANDSKTIVNSYSSWEQQDKTTLRFR